MIVSAEKRLQIFVHNVIILKQKKREIAKEKFYAAKKPIKIWDVNVNNIAISKSIKTKTNYEYLIEIKFDKAIKPLDLIMPKISGYVKKIKVEDKINKLVSFIIDDDMLLEKYESIWTKIENIRNIELNALPVYDDKCI